MEQLTRGRFSQGGVTYEGVASANGEVKNLSKNHGYFEYDGNTVYSRIIELASIEILNSTSELPSTAVVDEVYAVRTTSGVSLYIGVDPLSPKWELFKQLDNGDIVYCNGYYRYKSSAFESLVVMTIHRP